MLLVYLKRRCYPLFSSKFLIGQLYSNWPGSSSRTVINWQSVFTTDNVFPLGDNDFDKDRLNYFWVSKFVFLKNFIFTLKTHLQKINNQYQEVEKQLYAAKRRVDEQLEEINELYDLQHKLEQYTWRNFFEIHGVPESMYTSTEEVVLKLAEVLKVPINPDNIEISHKLNRKWNKPIIVKFISHKTKTRLYKARDNLRKIKLHNLFLGTHSPKSKDRISIYENLSSYRKKIVNEANRRRRDRELLKIWMMDGQICVKTLPDGRPIRIMELDDLKSL